MSHSRSLCLAVCASGMLLLPAAYAQISVPTEKSTLGTRSLSQDDLYRLARGITARVYSGDNSGSGILVAKNGQRYTVATNAHVVAPGKTYQVQTMDGKIHPAQLKHRGDSFVGNDIAILEFRSPANYALAALDLGSTVTSRESVFAAGFPFDSQSLTFTTGNVVLVADKPLVGGYRIGYTSTIRQGMSGGPLLNQQGKVIGILGLGSAILNQAYTYQDGSVPARQTLQQMQQANFALPIATIRPFISTVVASAAPTPLYQAAPSQPTVKTMLYAANLTGVAAQVDQIAQQTTLLIKSTNSGNGSGVIVAKQGQTYIVLTAGHVVTNPDTYQVVTPDGKQYPISPSQIQKFEGVDLALVRFDSSAAYTVATLADYYIGIEDRPLSFVSGFPGVSATKTGKHTRKLTAGTAFSPAMTLIAAQNSYSVANGYELVYSNLSYAGMSGGPVFDHLGRVIGINTAAEAEVTINQAGQETELNLGRSLGVPIRTFLGLAPKANLSPQLMKVVTTAPPKLSAAEIDSIQQSLLPAQPPAQNASELEWLNYGNELWRLRKYQNAVTAFDRAIQIKPDFYQAYYAKGVALDAQDQYQAAVATYDRVTQINPKFYEAWRQRAVVLDSLKQYPAALESISRAIQLQPDDPILYMRQGQLYLALSRYSEADQAFSQAIKLRPNTFSYGFRAQSRFNLKDYRGALADYSRQVELQPNDYFAYSGRGTINILLGNSAAAIADLTKAIELFPSGNKYRFTAYVARGTQRMVSGDIPGAIADYTATIEGKANEDMLVQAYLGRAQAYANSKDFPKAIADCSQLIALQPRNAVAYYNRGGFHAQAGNAQSAIADFDRAIALKPDYADAYRYRGATRIQLRDNQGAIADSQKAVSLYTAEIAREPNNPVLLINRSLARMNAQDQPGALQDAQKAEQVMRDQGMTSGPGYQLVQKLISALQGGSSTQSSTQQRSGSDSTQTRQPAGTPGTGSTSATAFFQQGMVRNEAQDYPGAIREFSKAIALQPNNVVAYLMRSSARLRIQDFQGALQDLEKAAQLQPDNAKIIELRDLLRKQLGS
jgi:tetratricopeptide (TPR) repeat protein/S1-C subfamily serine protease